MHPFISSLGVLPRKASVLEAEERENIRESHAPRIYLYMSFLIMFIFYYNRNMCSLQEIWKTPKNGKKEKSQQLSHPN